MKKKLAIIGAGIAGLTLANFLKKLPNMNLWFMKKRKVYLLKKVMVFNLQLNSIKILNEIDFKK